MATKMLESSAVSAFCESVAVMHSAGIQMDEAVFLLGENMEDAAFKRACDDVYKELIVGKPLALAMDDSGCFPSHVVDMVGAGEHAGRLENVLWSLARYYDEEDRLYAKIKNAIAYPAALLCVMSAILLFTVIVILPVFVDVYHGLTGNLTAGSFGYVNASIIIGWIALGVTLLCTVLVVLGVLAGRSAAGRQRLLRLFEKAPLTRGPMRQMAVSRRGHRYRYGEGRGHGGPWELEIPAGSGADADDGSRPGQEPRASHLRQQRLRAHLRPHAGRGHALWQLGNRAGKPV